MPGALSLVSARHYDKLRMSNRLRDVRSLESKIATAVGVGLNATVLSCLTALIVSLAGAGVDDQRSTARFGLLFMAVGLANLTGFLLPPGRRYFRATQGVLIAVNLIMAFGIAILANAIPRMFPFGGVRDYLYLVILFTLSAMAMYFRRPLRWPG